MDSEGLLLLTNDGEFSNMMTHPKYHLPKTYNLTVNGILSKENIKEENLNSSLLLLKKILNLKILNN